MKLTLVGLMYDGRVASAFIKLPVDRQHRPYMTRSTFTELCRLANFPPKMGTVGLW